jgi:hypothetical protein
LKEEVPGTIVGDEIAEAGALGARVLDMSHVDVKPPAVQEEPAVSRRLVVGPVVEVEKPGFSSPEKMIFNTVDDPIGRVCLGEPRKAAVFGLYPEQMSLHL